MNDDDRSPAGDKAEMIRRRMRQVRGQLREDASEIASATKSLTDWRAYFRQCPWLALGGAALVGFMVIPKRKAASAVDVGHLAEIIGRQKPPSRSASLAVSLVSTLAGIAARQAIRAVEGHLAKRLQPRNRPEVEPTTVAEKGTTHDYPAS